MRFCDMATRRAEEEAEACAKGVAKLDLCGHELKSGRVQEWLDLAAARVEVAAKGYRWAEDRTIISFLATEVEKAAKKGGHEAVVCIVQSSLPGIARGEVSWEAFCKALTRTEAGAAAGIARARVTRLNGMQQRDFMAGEYVEMFRAEAIALMGGKPKGEAILAFLADAVLRGLRSQQARNELRQMPYADFDQMMEVVREVATRCEAAEAAAASARRAASAASGDGKSSEAAGSRKGKSKGKGPAGQARPSQRGQISAAEQERRRDNGLCFNCTSADHKARDCTAPFVPEA